MKCIFLLLLISSCANMEYVGGESSSYDTGTFNTVPEQPGSIK